MRIAADSGHEMQPLKINRSPLCFFGYTNAYRIPYARFQVTVAQAQLHKTSITLHHFTICCVSNCGNQDPLHLEGKIPGSFRMLKRLRKPSKKGVGSEEAEEV